MNAPGPTKLAYARAWSSRYGSRVASRNPETRPGADRFCFFVLAKHLAGRQIDEVNASTDIARQDFVSAISALNAGKALRGKAGIRAAVRAVHERRHGPVNNDARQPFGQGTACGKLGQVGTSQQCDLC